MSGTHFNTYFITRSVSTVSDVIDQLKAAGVNENDIGVVSKNKDIVVADLPEADLSDKSQLPESLKRGAVLGSGTGLLAGVLLATFPVSGLTVGGAAILGMTAGGAGIGAWSASMIGISESSELVKQFEKVLDENKTLIFCRLNNDHREQIMKRINDVSGGQLD